MGNQICNRILGSGILYGTQCDEYGSQHTRCDGSINIEIAKYALGALNVDAHGLDEMDNKILSTIIDKFKGGPVGITTIATAVGESSETIEEVYEPFLIQQGFIMRTPRGREVTEAAYKHLGKLKQRPGELF